MTHNGAYPGVLDYQHFPGKENPIQNQSVMTEEEMSGGLTTVDSLPHLDSGYGTPIYSDDYSPLETLDQHDVANHPSVDTPSGLDHVNPRGQISTDGVLDVPESTVDHAELEDVLTKILSRNLSKITVRPETPTEVSFHSLVNIPTGVPVRLVTQDPDRAEVRIVVNSLTSAVRALVGKFEDVSAGVFGTGYLATDAAFLPIVVGGTDEIWINVLQQATNDCIVSWIATSYGKH